MRRWFWALAEYEYAFSDPPRWTHDDNRQAQPYGFVIVPVPDLKGVMGYKIVSLHRYTDISTIKKRVAQLAAVDPLCAKALAIITAQKLAGVE